jgi:phosphoglycerate dehydrogenase-like enzyme
MVRDRGGFDVIPKMERKLDNHDCNRAAKRNSTMINGADGKLKAGIIGTGKMGTHLAATWARAGIDVLLGDLL